MQNLSKSTSSTTVCLPYTLICCQNRQNELLMLRRTKPPFVGSWNFLGGKIDSDESALLSAQRELGEEAKIQVDTGSIRFRGVAIWPDQKWQSDLVGMFLFLVRPRIGRSDRRQMSVLDEGTVAWLPKDSLTLDGQYPVVPNFFPLISILLGNLRKPRILVHAKSDSVVLEMSPDHYSLHEAAKGRMILSFEDIFSSTDDFRKALRVSSLNNRD